jgi:hypothetical protein
MKSAALLVGLLCQLGARTASSQERIETTHQVSQVVETAGEDELAPPSSPVRVQVLAGGGIGTRAMRRPTLYGAQRLDASLFAALDIGVRVSVWPERAFALGVGLRYQTSIGWTVRDDPAFALATSVDVRAERVELAAGPTLRFGESPRSVALAIPIGFSVRTLWPDVHDLPVVGYSLLGPFARAELCLSLGDALALRVGPEVQWIVAVDQVVREQGAGPQGYALGGELVVQAPLGRKLALELTYRESHAFVPGQRGRVQLTDVERFATARLSGAL